MQIPTFKQKLIGAFDLLFLFGRGVKAFSGSKREARESIIIPIILIPLGVLFSVFFPPKGMADSSDYGVDFIAGFSTVHGILSYVFSMIAVGGIAYMLKREQHFPLFFTAANWTSVASTIIMLPLIAAMATGAIPREDADRILVITGLYSHLVLGVIAWRSLRLNWQLGIATSVAVMFIHQELLDFMYLLNGIPDPW